jgi:8-oxo-dGTP diphosphatase
MPFTYQWPHPAIAADIAVFACDDGHLGVLLIQRGEAPFAGSWALPGGFLKPDETVEVCARRELEEEAGITAPVDLVGIFSEPDRDPRERVVSIAHVAFVDNLATKVVAGSDAASADWFPIDDLPPLAFDHATIVRAALALAREVALRKPAAARMLPPTFTLAEFQIAQEALLGRKVDKRNFRREVVEAGWIERAGEERHGKGRPAEMWRISTAA